MTDIKDLRKARRPVRVIQFGEGNFLRGFADLMIDKANKAGVTDMGVAVCKPITYGKLDTFREQDCVYTVVLRGVADGKPSENVHVSESISSCYDCYEEYNDYSDLARLDSLRFVISNTTEAGITYDESDDISLCPPKTYPGKLTKFLYERYRHFNGNPDKGLIMLPVELIDENGKHLKECALKLCELWKLPAAFTDWLNSACVFCSTLVDRIITGYPAAESADLWKRFGYEDKLIVTGEPFGLWVIESDKPELVKNEFPLDKAGNPVIFTDDIKPYRERKVRVLNGAHTGTVLAAFLTGLDTVAECVNDPLVRSYMDMLIYTEIAPSVPLPPDEVKAFADAVMERFSNPYIRHELLSIALNSVSKWRARILPSLLDGIKRENSLPKCLTFSFAALLAFYRHGKLEGDVLSLTRDKGPYTTRDDKFVMEFFAKYADISIEDFVKKSAGETSFWGMDLNGLEGFTGLISKYLDDIEANGVKAAMERLIKS